MVGIITARGIIEGHLPELENRDSHHRVAYAGRVPVKLVGKHKPNDVIVPSGKNDGTAVAVDLSWTWGVSLCAGRIPDAEQDKQRISLPGRYELVDCIVINPSQTTGLAHRNNISCGLQLAVGALVAVLVLLTAFSGEAGLLSPDQDPLPVPAAHHHR